MRENELKKLFGVSIRSWRKRLGMSQEELAERATLHRTYISDVERGARNVSLQSIERLARALDTSLPALFAYDANPNPTPSVATNTGVVDILYAETEPGEVLAMTRAFKQDKIINRIFVVRDGASALDFLFATGQFAGRTPGGHSQLVLLDWELPRVSGSEVLRRIRKDPRTRSIPVVALCDAGDERAIAMSIRKGANACLTKPLDLQRFSSVLQRINLHWALYQTPSNRPRE